MPQVLIRKINEVHLQIHAEDHIYKELGQTFSFMAPGYQHDTRYQKGWWDGSMKLFNQTKHTLYIGLLPRLEQWLIEKEYTYQIQDESLYLLNEFSLIEAREFAESLKPHSLGNLLVADDYQIEGFAQAIRRRRVLIESPTASGKSLIAYFICRYLLDKNHARRILIIVPTQQLVKQLRGDFIDYSSVNKWTDQNDIALIMEGMTKHTDTPITISTWQSIYSLDESYFNNFDAIIGDECHHFKAKSLKEIMENATQVKWRIGMTGTLEDTQVHQLVLEGLFGSVFKTVSVERLIASGRLADFEIKCIILTYPKDETPKAVEYRDEVKWLISNERRTRYIRNLACSLKGNTLILYQYVDTHGKLIYDAIKAKVGSTRKVFFISGDIDVEIREEFRRLVEIEKDAIIVASIGTTATGINIKNLHNLIFASPSKKRIRIMQSIGRSLRKGSDKSRAILFDIADDLKWDDLKNYSLQHFIQRLKIYATERFRFKIYNVQLG
jgi:superfamily II DNA or RNA helicase